jgi:hypothetical protein
VLLLLYLFIFLRHLKAPKERGGGDYSGELVEVKTSIYMCPRWLTLVIEIFFHILTLFLLGVHVQHVRYQGLWQGVKLPTVLGTAENHVFLRVRVTDIV